MQPNPIIDTRGKLAEPDPDNPGSFRLFVYQKVAPGAGNIPNGGAFDRQRRRHVIPTNPDTPAQQDRRAAFAAAVSAWQALTPPERDEWRIRALSTDLPAYQYFLSRQLR